MIYLFQTAGIIEWGGFLIIALLVFAETGLLLGLVVPGGETLLFTAGLLVSTGTLGVSVAVLLASLIAAGIAGDISGYMIGRRFGRRLYRKKNTWYFNRKYLFMAESFLEKHGRITWIFGKFLPVVRPFSPVISGTTGRPFPLFLSFSALACLLYMGAFVLGGYFLGSRYPGLKHYLGWILPISIVISLIPVYLQYRKFKTERQAPEEKKLEA